VLNGITVVCDEINLKDVMKPFAKNKLGCEEDNFTFWNLEKLLYVCVTNVVGILHVSFI
jgi:hypothetical protein